MVDQPHSGPVAVEIKVFLKRYPRHANHAVPIDGGDVDNYAKMVLDALHNIVYVDDRQVISLKVEKVFCGSGGEPRTEVAFYLGSTVHSAGNSIVAGSSSGKKRALPSVISDDTDEVDVGSSKGPYNGNRGLGKNPVIDLT